MLYTFAIDGDQVLIGSGELTKPEVTRIKFDLPNAYIRAINVRAAYYDLYPRDIVMEALDAYLPTELAEVRERIGIQQSAPAKKRGGRKE